MSTKVTLASRPQEDGRPGFHLYEDVLDSLAADNGADAPVYLRLDGVAVELRTTEHPGAYEGPVRIQLELAGFLLQQLNGPNSEPKDKPQLRYVFGLPQALAPRACTDAKVTVTSVSGEVSVASFGFCAGQGLGLEA